MEETKEKKEEGLFQGSSGGYSMRRLLAFLFALAALLGGGFAIFRGSEWQVIAAISGIFSAASLLLMLFTTWSDVANAVAKVKENK